MSGGHLDLDANAACSSNVSVDNEHVFWPRGRAPAGTYRVNVAHWRSCIEGRSVAYRVTVRACGETVVLSGRFDGGGRTHTCDRRRRPGLVPGGSDLRRAAVRPVSHRKRQPIDSSAIRCALNALEPSRPSALLLGHSAP